MKEEGFDQLVEALDLPLEDKNCRPKVSLRMVEETSKESGVERFGRSVEPAQLLRNSADTLSSHMRRSSFQHQS